MPVLFLYIVQSYQLVSVSSSDLMWHGENSIENKGFNYSLRCLCHRITCICFHMPVIYFLRATLGLNTVHSYENEFTTCVNACDSNKGITNSSLSDQHRELVPQQVTVEMFTKVPKIKHMISRLYKYCTFKQFIGINV